MGLAFKIIYKRGWTKFSRFIKFAVGDGARIKFWYVAWCGDVILKEAFPELYCIVNL